MNCNFAIGNDLVHIERLKRAIKNPAFIEKVFHEIEAQYCGKKVDPAASFAARFAAKEAFAKALGIGFYATPAISPKDVWIQNEDSGKPVLCLSPKAQEIMTQLGFSKHSVSLAHHVDYALAHVILWG